METLLDIANTRFGLAVDRDSDGGQVLGAFTPTPALPQGGLKGKAGVSALTLGITPNGKVSVRAATGGEVLTLGVPPGSWDFAFVVGLGGAVTVEIELYSPRIRLPGLRRAQRTADNLLREAGAGNVELVPPRLLLIVEARPGQRDAGARIGPSRNAEHALEVAVDPPTFLVGPGTVLGFHLSKVELDLENAAGARIKIKKFEVFAAPPGIAALAMYGGGELLDIEFGTPGGLTGEFTLAAGDDTSRPNFLKEPKLHLRLNRSSVVLLELLGRIELNTEITRLLGSDISDGPQSLRYRLSLTLGDGRAPGDDWKTSLELRGEGGGDLLWRSKRGATGSSAATTARNTLGAYAVFAPLLVEFVPASGSSGYVDLGIGAGLAGGLALGGVVTTDQVTIYSAELSAGSTGGVTAASLFFDVESDINIKVHGVLASKRPIRVRQKAVGIRLDLPGGELKPVFDPGNGFSLDLSDPGMFEVAEPLGSFLQPQNPGIARENPLVLEFTLAPKADLGVVTIDKATVRVPLEGGTPSLTALGARVGLPGMSGSGELAILPTGFKGAFDLSLGSPLGLRVAAGLSLIGHGGYTSVRMNVEVGWPVPIPLANSGLGLFGILGMFAVNERRSLRNGETSLGWYHRAPDRNPAKGDWDGVEDAWALGLGAVVGTLEGGYLINAKGLLLLELPGPRVALFMEAKLLAARPDVSGTDTGNLLAVIEISEQSLLIGIVARYEMPFLLALEVPAEAYFDFKQVENWHIDIGQVDGIRVSVRFMNFLRAEGYLMLHGDGIPALMLDGFAVAAGIEAALTWGPEPIGLYVRVAARADVALSFNPPMVRGNVGLSGELHLFIISIGVSAEAGLLISAEQFHIRATFSGRVDFFFFEVEGSVTFELGTEGLQPPAAPALLRAVSLHARGSALLPGSGVAGPIDGSLGDAAADGAEGPVVPIDAIPVLQFEMTPRVDGVTFAGRAIVERLMPDGWVRRGRRFYRYVLAGISLEAVDSASLQAVPPLVGTLASNAWWDQRPATPQGVVGDDDGAQLALLSWVPSATPAAARRTVERDTAIKRRWGTACDEVAPATGVLWTFAAQSIGAAPGWTLCGIAGHAAGTRTRPPKLNLKVREPWRRGGVIADTLFSVRPGFVTGPTGADHRFLVAPYTGDQLVPRLDHDVFKHWADAFDVDPALDALPDAIRLGGDGLRYVRGLVFARRETGQLSLRALRSDGSSTGFEESIYKQVFDLGDLPWDEWRAGAWKEPVADAYDAWRGSRFGHEFGGQLYCFEFDLPEDTASIDIGMPFSETPDLTNWGLLAFEAITEAEVRRHDFDTTHRKEMIKVIDGALGVDASPRALLRPGTSYTLHVDYTVIAVDPDANGDPVPEPGQPVAHRQTHRFCTDRTAPAAIEPFVVATSPEQGADAIFYGDKVCIVFANSTVRRMYRQHGVSLFAKVRAASGRHPLATTGVSLDTVGAPIDIAAQVHSPFISALRDAMQGSCVPVDVREGEKHEMLTIPMTLEASTGYTLDIEGVDASGAQVLGTRQNPALRRTFSTSRYKDAAAFAAAVKAAPVGHRHIADPAALTGLPAGAAGRDIAVSDLALETALRRLEWGDLARPAKPRVTVLWQGGPEPVPFAIYVETHESAWRSRGTPRQVPDAAGTLEWKLEPQLWLSLESASPAVTRLVRTTSGMRTLVLLGNGARGQRVVLKLRRHHHKLFEASEAPPPPADAMDVTLAAAPWENG